MSEYSIMENLENKNFYEQLQKLEYISLAGIFSIIIAKVSGIDEAVAFTAYHFKRYIKEGFSFYDVSKYDPICDFLDPPTIAKGHVTNLLQEVLKLHKIPNKEESKLYPLFHSIACHRVTLETLIGFSLLTDNQAQILSLESTQETKEPSFNDDTVRRLIVLIASNEFFDERGKLLSYSKIHTALQHKHPNAQIPAKNTIKKMLAE